MVKARAASATRSAPTGVSRRTVSRNRGCSRPEARNVHRYGARLVPADVVEFVGGERLRRASLERLDVELELTREELVDRVGEIEELVDGPVTRALAHRSRDLLDQQGVEAGRRDGTRRPSGTATRRASMDRGRGRHAHARSEPVPATRSGTQSAGRSGVPRSRPRPLRPPTSPVRPHSVPKPTAN